MITTAQSPVKFNPFVPGFREDPYTTYQGLRQQNPIHYTFDMWIVTKYQDIIQVLNSDAVSVNYIPQYVVQQKVGDIPGLVELGKGAIVFTDPPDHARLRRLAGQAFSNTNINAHTAYVQQLIEELIAPRIQEASFDFAQIAHQLPLYTLAHLLGIPHEYIKTIDQYIHRVRSILEPSLLTKMRIRRIEEDLQACLAIFQEIIDYRKTHLGDDLLSKLIQARVGEDRLSDSELSIACVMTFVAGHETSKGLLTNGILAFIQHPKQWQIFREGKATNKQVINEILRFDPPLQQTVRLAVSDLQVGSEIIHKGEKMLLCLASANRDEDQFDNPDTFDITRDAAAQIAFGHGIHNCLGQMIARLEGQLLFTYLCERVQEIRLSNPDYRWHPEGFITRTLTYLPVTFIPAA
ncbi:cytochrome P450 [Nostoc sp. CENA67]|uniref:Cytochrome P450 n=1 Tax=Amazonocrinis nigriterrae CENA67 TaxID=2794033 RepID=A0A8J7LA72_9NOST|nr:cytochrome P450 [Amazonocrinis nigriterrae]MBH8565208.1 cytochrome P450 [Amazonocrinis nigriterrae CENA67]